MFNSFFNIVALLISTSVASLTDPIVESIIELDTLESFYTSASLRYNTFPSDIDLRDQKQKAFSEYLNGINKVLGSLQVREKTLKESIKRASSGNEQTYSQYKSRHSILLDALTVAQAELTQITPSVTPLDIEEIEDIVIRGFDIRLQHEAAKSRFYNELMLLGSQNGIQAVKAALEKIWTVIRNKNKTRPELVAEISFHLKLNKVRKDRVLSRLNSLLERHYQNEK